MRARLAVICAASLCITALPVLSDRDASATLPDPSSTTTVTSSTTASTTTTTMAPAVAGEPATRGSMVQLTPTLPPPPPPTTAPPTLPPPGPYDLPWLSGEGRRIVYSKGRQRVWVIDGRNTIIRTYLVSGKLSQPPYGTFYVFSRSSYTCNIDRYWVCMRWMIRFTKGPEGDNIGFHEIPKDGDRWVQTNAQLGQALSGGCIRQATEDAWFLWNWAGIGTKVVVTP